MTVCLTTLERWIQGWSEDYSEEQVRGRIEHKIGRYTRGQIQNYPTDADKVLDFIICLRHKTTRDIYLWRASGTVVEPIEYYDLIGCDEPLYRYEAERLYEKDRPTKISAITLGVHLLSMGKATAISIDEPFQVIGISKEQVWVETPAFVDSLAHKVERVNSTLSKLILGAHGATTTIMDADFTCGAMKGTDTNWQLLLPQRARWLAREVHLCRQG